MKTRLDSEIARRGLVETRSQAEQEIDFGNVAVNGKIVTKSSFLVSETDKIRLIKKNPYVSRAGLKLASVAGFFKLNFKDKVVLDVGSSTGGFTDFALQNGARQVVAVDVGTAQMHPKLRPDKRLQLHEKTDIRAFATEDRYRKFLTVADIILIDVSFISLREILPSVSNLTSKISLLVAMCKPQFEAGASQTNKGVIKNEKIRRDIFQGFELWLKDHGFIIVSKRDSEIAGEKGNRERFYLLKAT